MPNPVVSYISRPDEVQNFAALLTTNLVARAATKSNNTAEFTPDIISLAALHQGWYVTIPDLEGSNVSTDVSKSASSAQLTASPPF